MKVFRVVHVDQALIAFQTRNCSCFQIYRTFTVECLKYLLQKRNVG